MTVADKYYKEAVNEILINGISDNDMDVRPKWPDGTPAHTIKTFCYICRYDLSKEFPILTLRKQAFKTAVKELLWMWQAKSNIVADLNAKIWNAWELPDGTIGKTYGYQLAQKFAHHKENNEWIYLDQVDALIYDLKNNPASRRIITTMWNQHDLKDMALAPCVYETIWDVTPANNHTHYKKLNLTLIQRSGDLLAAAAPGGFDCIEYALLQCAIAQVCGYIPGEFVHLVNNLHIYDRHINIAKQICNNQEFAAPILWINPKVKNWYDFKETDFQLIDYQATNLTEKFEVAI